MPDRRERALRDLEIAGSRGLEIGPLYQPMTSKQDMNVVYVDVQTRELLVEHYSKHPGVPVEDIVDIDFALIDDSGKVRSLATVMDLEPPFDWVLASHVIEHVPDMIGWLDDVAAILADGGMLSLIIPDRRFTFDARRQPTTVGQLIQANRGHDPHPSVRAIFDHFYEAATVDAGAVWSRTAPAPPPRMHPLQYVQEMLEQSKDPDAHIDCHVWIFEPKEFLEQLGTLATLDLVQFSVESILPTATFENEFFVTLVRTGRELDAPTRTALISASVERALADVEAAREPADVGAEERFSAKELRLIETKRNVMRQAHTWLNRARKVRGRAS